MWDTAEQLQVLSSSSILVLERKGNARGCPRANRQLSHLPCQSQDPEQQLPALWHWCGAAVPAPRAVGLAWPEHTSCSDLGFLFLEIPWLSCS